MRSRDKRLSDYGVPESETKELYQKCKNLTGEETDLLVKAALECCPIGLVNPVLQSLMRGLSYDALSGKMYIPIKPHDFYGYRRKTIAKFYHVLKGDEQD